MSVSTLAFETVEVEALSRTLHAACLVTDPHEITAETTQIMRDGEQLATDPSFVRAVCHAVKACDRWEQSDYGVDCAVFGTVALGGHYTPVSDEIYHHSLRREIRFGRWLGKEDLLGMAPKPMLVQFGRFTEGHFLPVHTAVKVPAVVDTYVQKVGHNLPVALCGTIENMRFHGSNTAMSIDLFQANYFCETVLDYDDRTPGVRPTGVYKGLPG